MQEQPMMSPGSSIQQTPGTQQHQQQQQQRTSDDKYIKCNQCLEPIRSQKNILIQKCFHVLCVPCANELLAGATQCPICACVIDLSTDVKGIETTDEAMKAMQERLCTFNPEQIFQIVRFGEQFWWSHRSQMEPAARQSLQQKLQQQAQQKVQNWMQQQTQLQHQQNEEICMLEEQIRQLEDQLNQFPQENSNYISSTQNNQLIQPVQNFQQQQQHHLIESSSSPYNVPHNQTSNDQFARTPGLRWQPEKKTTAAPNHFPSTVRQHSPFKANSGLAHQNNCGPALSPVAVFGPQRGRVSSGQSPIRLTPSGVPSSHINHNNY